MSDLEHADRALRSAGVEDTERAALAACLYKGAAVDELLSLGVTLDLFANPAWKAIWTACCEDRQRRRGPDHASLLARWDRHRGTWGPWERMADLVADLRLLAGTPNRLDHLRAYTEVLCDAHSRRCILEAAKRILLLDASGEPTENLLSSARNGIEEASTIGGARVEMPLMLDLVETEGKRRLAVLASGGNDTRLHTGLVNLDQILEIHPGSYTVVAGRPAMGKTQFGLSLIGGIARNHGHTLFISIEMAEDALARRALASEYFDPCKQYEIEDAIRRAKERWQGAPVHIDTKSSSLSQVLASMRLAKMRYGISAVVVDYLQKMRIPKTRTGNREQEIAGASLDLCLAAKELGVALIVLAQVNRECEKRGDKRPMVSDLRESGALEQDVDNALLLYRDVVYDSKTLTPWKCEVNVAKQRNGPNGTAELYFRPGQGWFEDWGGR